MAKHEHDQESVGDIGYNRCTNQFSNFQLVEEHADGAKSLKVRFRKLDYHRMHLQVYMQRTFACGRGTYHSLIFSLSCTNGTAQQRWKWLKAGRLHQNSREWRIQCCLPSIPFPNSRSLCLYLKLLPFLATQPGHQGYLDPEVNRSVSRQNLKLSVQFPSFARRYRPQALLLLPRRPPRSYCLSFLYLITKINF